jgi:CMP-N-acetylneuraminic acid synthetase
MFVLKKKSLFDGKIKAVEVPKIRSLDIDDSYDFEIADYFLSKKSKNNEKN